MSTPELIPLEPDEPFHFACRPGLPCFNACCRDLNQALTPYDTLRLRAYLQMDTRRFGRDFLDIQPGPATGWPVAMLRFADQPDRRCPFVGDAGCRVYPARPSSCRMYPLVRALRRSRHDGCLVEQYALLREPHCRGCEQPQPRTVQEWICDQALADYLGVNDRLMDLIALKNRLRPGPLAPDHWHWACAAFYDLDTLQQNVLAGELPASGRTAFREPPLAGAGDVVWLTWALDWLRALLFGRI